jgi:hypothetical protein
MKKQYSLEEIKNNLYKFSDYLEKKKIEGFWVIASRKDFKPLKIETDNKGKKTKKTLLDIDDVRKYLLKDNYKYYVGKTLVYIQITFNRFILENKELYDEDNPKLDDYLLCRFSMKIYEIDENGKIGNDTKQKKNWECQLNFTTTDLRKMKLQLKDAEYLMREVIKRKIKTYTPIGITFQEYKTEIKKK